jgi:uncharacterized protein YecT (DUF1311 family)
MSSQVPVLQSRPSLAMQAVKHTSIHLVLPLTLAIIAALSGEATGQSAASRSGTQWPACKDIARTQIELNACARAAQRAAEERLDKSYQAVMCQLDAGGKSRLASVQQAWIAFRDADCVFWRGDGSMAPMNEAYCRATLANARAKELDGWPPNAPRNALAACH